MHTVNLATVKTANDNISMHYLSHVSSVLDPLVWPNVDDGRQWVGWRIASYWLLVLSYVDSIFLAVCTYDFVLLPERGRGR